MYYYSYSSSVRKLSIDARYSCLVIRGLRLESIALVLAAPFASKSITIIAIILAAGVVSVVSGKLRLLMVELTTVMLSIKIIYMIHVQMRVNHFKFWILSAIEWRINEVMAEIKQLKR